MYHDFLASPELALECLRQESHVNYRKAEHHRLALHTMVSRPSSFSALFSVVKERLSRSYLWLKLKPKLASMSVSSR